MKISARISLGLATILAFMCTTPAFANRIDAEKDGVKISVWPSHTENSLISITVVLENTTQHSVRNINYEVTFTCGKKSETASPNGGNYASKSDPWPSLPPNDKVGFQIELCGVDFSEVSINSASILTFDQDAPNSSSAAPAPEATAQGPTFKETLDWLISQNVRAGFKVGLTFTRSFKDGAKDYVQPGSPQDIEVRSCTRVEGNTECAAAIFDQGTEDPALFQPIPDQVHLYSQTFWIDFTALKPVSIGVNQVVLRSHREEFPATDDHAAYTEIYKYAPDPLVYYEIIGLNPVVNGKQSQSSLSYVAYSDQDLANRVAKALNHAIEVCSGMPKLNPF